MIKAFKEKSIPVVAIVRKNEHVEELKSTYGLEHAINMTDEDFEDQLRVAAKETKATVALECIAGDMPGKILGAMGKGAICIVYGALSE